MTLTNDDREVVQTRVVAADELRAGAPLRRGGAGRGPDLIQQTILDADDQAAQMLRSIRHHAAVVDAVQAGDAVAASRLARETLYQYYADHVGAEDREIMADLVLECGGRVDF